MLTHNLPEKKTINHHSASIRLNRHTQNFGHEKQYLQIGVWSLPRLGSGVYTLSVDVHLYIIFFDEHILAAEPDEHKATFRYPSLVTITERGITPAKTILSTVDTRKVTNETLYETVKDAKNNSNTIQNCTSRQANSVRVSTRSLRYGCDEGTGFSTPGVRLQSCHSTVSSCKTQTRSFTDQPFSQCIVPDTLARPKK